MVFEAKHLGLFGCVFPAIATSPNETLGANRSVRARRGTILLFESKQKISANSCNSCEKRNKKNEITRHS